MNRILLSPMFNNCTDHGRIWVGIFLLWFSVYQVLSDFLSGYSLDVIIGLQPLLVHSTRPLSGIKAGHVIQKNTFHTVVGRLWEHAKAFETTL